MKKLITLFLLFLLFLGFVACNGDEPDMIYVPDNFTENIVYDYDDFYGFIVTLPLGWAETYSEVSLVYTSDNGNARISVSFLYCMAGSYDECENASEVLDVLMYLSGINFDADRYSLIEKASYPGTDYDIHRIIYHDFNQWSPLWNDVFIVSDGKRHFKIELSASFEEDYHSHLEDIKFVVDNFIMK
jgi:hypothetical protein